MYSLSCQVLSQVNSAKYLGIEITVDKYQPLSSESQSKHTSRWSTLSWSTAPLFGNRTWRDIRKNWRTYSPELHSSWRWHQRGQEAASPPYWQTSNGSQWKIAAELSASPFPSTDWHQTPQRIYWCPLDPEQMKNTHKIRKITMHSAPYKHSF